MESEWSMRRSTSLRNTLTSLHNRSRSVSSQIRSSSLINVDLLGFEGLMNVVVEFNSLGVQCLGEIIFGDDLLEEGRQALVKVFLSEFHKVALTGIWIE